MAEPIRLVLVEDNQVFREALELLLGLQSDIVVVATVGDGSSAAEVVRAHNPDVVLMDYRLPGLDGVQATRAVREACPDVAVVCLTASANFREVDALYEAGAVACLSKDQELDEIVEAIRERRLMNLTAANTAIVLDSTADFPEAPDRFPNWRVVPLYVLFGDASYRDYVELTPEEFYARLRTAAELPTTSQPTPGDFLTTYEELSGYERIYSIHLSSALSGTYQSATTAAAELGDKVRVIDSETASAAIAMLGLAIQRRLDRGTTDDEIDTLIGRFKDRGRPDLHRRHARVPAARRTDRPRERVGREPVARQAHPHDQARGRSAEARARKPEGDAGIRVGVHLDDRGHADAEGRDRACRRARARGAAEEDGARGASSRGGRDRDDARCSRRNARRAGHRRVLLVR